MLKFHSNVINADIANALVWLATLDKLFVVYKHTSALYPNYHCNSILAAIRIIRRIC